LKASLKKFIAWLSELCKHREGTGC
jgi:hypothetical protein